MVTRETLDHRESLETRERLDQLELEVLMDQEALP